MQPPPSLDDLRPAVQRWMPAWHPRDGYRLVTDTSDFFKVDYGDVLYVGGAAYLVRQNAKEGRFGLDDEEKFWVKRAVDLASGQRKIIKLVFHEHFTAHIAGIRFECYRSPAKEARILERVCGHPGFMQGRAVTDAAGNLVRIIDYIYGKSLARTVEELAVGHAEYFATLFPAMLDRFIAAVEAIAFLHAVEEKHGDIRRDHLLVDSEQGHYRWIDFDFNYRQRDNIFSYDLFGLGNILVFLVGKGDVLTHDLRRSGHPVVGQLDDADMNVVFHHRVAALGKIYPYLPVKLNRILEHFALGARWFYETTGQLLEDLNDCRQDLGR